LGFKCKRPLLAKKKKTTTVNLWGMGSLGNERAIDLKKVEAQRKKGGEKGRGCCRREALGGPNFERNDTRVRGKERKRISFCGGGEKKEHIKGIITPR